MLHRKCISSRAAAPLWLQTRCAEIGHAPDQQLGARPAIEGSVVVVVIRAFAAIVGSPVVVRTEGCH